MLTIITTLHYHYETFQHLPCYFFYCHILLIRQSTILNRITVRESLFLIQCWSESMKRERWHFATWLPNFPPMPSLPPAHPRTPLFSFSENCLAQLQLTVFGMCSGREVGEVAKPRAYSLAYIYFIPPYLFLGSKIMAVLLIWASLFMSQVATESKIHSGLPFTPRLSSICGSLPLSVQDLISEETWNPANFCLSRHISVFSGLKKKKKLIIFSLLSVASSGLDLV